jgi:hypothetical protein
MNTTPHTRSYLMLTRDEDQQLLTDLWLDAIDRMDAGDDVAPGDMDLLDFADAIEAEASRCGYDSVYLSEPEL